LHYVVYVGTILVGEVVQCQRFARRPLLLSSVTAFKDCFFFEQIRNERVTKFIREPAT
jgi:hypothetical protein